MCNAIKPHTVCITTYLEAWVPEISMVLNPLTWLKQILTTMKMNEWIIFIFVKWATFSRKNIQKCSLLYWWGFWIDDVIWLDRFSSRQMTLLRTIIIVYSTIISEHMKLASISWNKISTSQPVWPRSLLARLAYAIFPSELKYIHKLWLLHNRRWPWMAYGTSGDWTWHPTLSSDLKSWQSRSTVSVSWGKMISAFSSKNRRSIHGCTDSSAWIEQFILGWKLI